MPEKRHLIAGLGEVLWDLFPEGKQLGGAPANFAYISTLLGNRGVVASRVGNDALGAEALQQLHAHTLDCAYIQRDPQLPTGTVKVQVGPQGQPSFEISEPVAWDALEWTQEWRSLAGTVDAVCFGSLAQRSSNSRETILAFLENIRPATLRVFDVNLRLQNYSPEILSSSCDLADVIKMNDDELPKILDQLHLAQGDMETSARRMCEAYNLRLVCITRGSGGSLLVAKTASHSHPGIPVKVVDTVGAGDAFAAGLVHEYLCGKFSEEKTLKEHELAVMNERGNRMGAWVASHAGGMPDPKKFSV